MVDGELFGGRTLAFHPPEGVATADRNSCFTQSRFSSDVCTLIPAHGHCRCAWALQIVTLDLRVLYRDELRDEVPAMLEPWRCRTRENIVHGSLPGRTARTIWAFF